MFIRQTIFMNGKYQLHIFPWDFRQMKKRLRMISRGQVDDKYSFLYIWLVDFYGIDLFFKKKNFNQLQPQRKSRLIKLICLVFRAIYDTMTVIMLVTAGNFLMEITLEFVASIFVMTKQRFPHILFVCYGIYISCIGQVDRL